MTSSRTARLITALVVLAGVVLAGCSSGGGTKTPAGGAHDVTLGGKTVGAAGSQFDVSKLCAAVPEADVQALMKDSAPKPNANPDECDWLGAIKVDVFANDADKKYYTGGGMPSDPAQQHAMSGVGDVAVWFWPVPNKTLPWVSAQKGTTTLGMSVDLAVDHSSVTYTGSDPFFTITDADGQKFAEAEAKVLTDMFNALG
ncbi:MAG: hypothetical protein ACR2KJ_00375 [Jatrophihabitans sp.]